MKVVFVDHGDMFRSQVAKAFYNKYKTDDGRAYSYGTNVSDRMLQGIMLKDWSGLEILITEMKKYDIDISNEYSDQLKEEYLNASDKLIVMTEKEYIPEWLKKYKFEYWEIPNPEVHERDEIENIVKLLKEKILTLIEVNE